MKNYSIPFAAWVAAAALLASCAKDMDAPRKEDAGGKEAKEVLLTIRAGGDDNTKTYIDGSVIKWASSGEYLRVFEAATPSAGPVQLSTGASMAGTTSDGGTTMAFDVSLPDKSTGYTSFNYYAIYPNSSYQGNSGVNNVTVELKETQTPTATSYDPSADFLIARPVKGQPSQATSMSMAFARAVALGKITITNLPTTDPVTEVRFSAVAGDALVLLAGQTSFNLETARPVSGYGDIEPAYELALDYTALAPVANTSMDVFFSCYPFELTTGDSFTLSVKTASYTYTRTVTLPVSRTVSFVPGKVSRFSVNMSTAVEMSNEQDLPYALLTYDLASANGLTTSYATNRATDIVGARWSWNAYKGSGIQLRNNDVSSYIKLPTFTEDIRKVVIRLSSAYSGKSLKFDSSVSSNAGSLYSLSLTSATEYEIDFAGASISARTAFIHAVGGAINIASVEVYAGADEAVPLATPAGVTAALTEDGLGGHIANSITVGWTAVEHADYYIVTLTPEEGDAVQARVETNSATLDGLELMTTYAVGVVAYAYNKGAYTASDPGTCSSVTTDPPSVFELTFTSISNKCSSYTANWDQTCGGFTWTLSNFNNNNGGWTGAGIVKCGRNGTASTASIVTKTAIPMAVASVELNFEALTTTGVNSITLYVDTANTFDTPNLQTIAGSVASGTQYLVVPNPAADCYYKLVIVCNNSVSSNGFVVLSSVVYSDVAPALATVITGAATGLSATGATLQGSFAGATGAIGETGFYYGTTSGSLGNKVSTGSTTSPFSKALTGLTAGTTYYFKAYVTEYNEKTSAYEERLGAESSFTTKAVATATVSTGSASGVTQTTAVLSGSYSGASGSVDYTGFVWGTSPGSLANDAMGSGTSSPFTATLTGLTEETTYYFKAYVAEYNESTASYEYRYGSVQSFTTSAPGPMAPGYLGCYEVPAIPTLNGSGTSGTYSDRADNWLRYYTTNAQQQVATHTYNGTRTYTVLYDGSKYAPVWTAHAMHAVTWKDNNVGRNDSWTDDPAISLTQQTGLDNSGSVGYSRGHLVASNYRQTAVKQNKQTFYYTNQAPQWQNSFNSGVWSNLEEAVVAHVPSGRDTLYIVTGVLYEYVGSVPTLPSSGLNVPIPSHFYKCLMKCSFNSSGVMTAASGCAYIFTNEAHGGMAYSDGITTIDAIEARAGFDFFPNVPAALQAAAEAQSSGLW